MRHYTSDKTDLDPKSKPADDSVGISFDVKDVLVTNSIHTVEYGLQVGKTSWIAFLENLAPSLKRSG